MNKRLKSTAIMMALIITLSVFTSLAATTTAAAATTTTTKITTSNKYPAVGQAVTFTVTLKAGTTGLSKPVKIWHTFNGVRYEDGTHNTVNGVYKFTQAFGSKGPRIYYAKFAGDSKYAASSGTVTVNVQDKKPTTTTMNMIRVHCEPPFGCDQYVAGYLKDKITGKPIAGATVKVEHKVGSTWTNYGSGVTDSTGRYDVYYAPNDYGYYRGHFLGNTLYAPSISNELYAWSY
jgi:hypothetical protein